MTSWIVGSVGLGVAIWGLSEHAACLDTLTPAWAAGRPVCNAERRTGMSVAACRGANQEDIGHGG